MKEKEKGETNKQKTNENEEYEHETKKKRNIIRIIIVKKSQKIWREKQNLVNVKYDDGWNERIRYLS